MTAGLARLQQGTKVEGLSLNDIGQHVLKVVGSGMSLLCMAGNSADLPPVRQRCGDVANDAQLDQSWYVVVLEKAPKPRIVLGNPKQRVQQMYWKDVIALLGSRSPICGVVSRRGMQRSHGPHRLGGAHTLARVRRTYTELRPPASATALSAARLLVAYPPGSSSSTSSGLCT